jgi:hypothetical protein
MPVAIRRASRFRTMQKRFLRRRNAGGLTFECFHFDLSAVVFKRFVLIAPLPRLLRSLVPTS